MSIGKLPKSAYELAPGETYEPRTQGQDLPEFTLKAVLTGIFLGVVFGAANTYLGLKAGLTISTSIPVAVLTVVVFRTIASAGGKYNILETNMSQTIGSASSSVASGAIFTLPALFMWSAEAAEINPQWKQLTLLAMCGGLLGVLAMIPLRRFLIKREHGNLVYPEGMACAEVLVASEAGGSQAAGVFAGIGAGIFFKLLTSGLKVLPETFQAVLRFPPRGSIGISVSPALIGVGYILGLRVASVMVAGAALSFLVLIPAIYAWGKGQSAPVYPETELLIANMQIGQLWNRYIRYIGAGAVATAGIITLIKSIPTMIESFRVGIAELGSGAKAALSRTDRDLPFRTVLLLLAAVVATLAIVPGILGYLDSYVVRAVAAILAAIFAFFFVTVSSRIVGLVGQTSNPISGMTIASLIGTSFVFLMFGWTDLLGQATALMVGTVICIAASIAGDTSQDLKTGFILGATPRTQQIGELIGVITSAGAVCWVLMLLDDNYILGSPALPAPQGTLMKLVIEGVLQQNLPWNLVFIGAGLSIIVAVLQLPALAFAVGVYLPLDTMAAIFVGGLLRWFLTRNTGPVGERRREQGILFCSGLVGGGGLTGVLLALWVVWSQRDPDGYFTSRITMAIDACTEWVGNLVAWQQQGLALAGIVAIASTVAVWTVMQGRDEQ